jgi:hypothetical protein
VRDGGFHAGDDGGFHAGDDGGMGVRDDGFHAGDNDPDHEQGVEGTGTGYSCGAPKACGRCSCPTFAKGTNLPRILVGHELV